jgi:flagellar assembly protein FliH
MFDPDALAEDAPVPHGSFVLSHATPGFRPWRSTSTALSSGELPKLDLVELARREGYAAGYADGETAAADALAGEALALTTLLAAAEALQPMAQGELARMLAQAVSAMIDHIGGTMAVDDGALAAYAKDIAAFAADELDCATLAIHPDDVAFLAGAGLPVPIKPDANLVRGSLRLETRHGWIEDGPTLRLARFRAALAQMVTA